MRYSMGVDIGTFESKGVLIDDDARVIAYHACAHKMESPRPGWAEHDAENTWWGELCEISKRLIASSGVSPRDVRALAVSTIAPCCLPVDERFMPLSAAILYGVDVRASKEIDQLNKEIGEDAIFARAATPLTTQSAAAKILWLKHNRKEIYDRTAKFLTGSSFLVARLTGACPIDRYTAATFVPLYDVKGEDWADDLAGICRRDQLADCRWTDEIAGEITEAAARETGLCAGTAVTVGTADAAAEALSVGVLSPGDMMLMYGSSIFMIHVVDRLTVDKRLWAGPYLFPNTYSVAAGMSCAGTLTRWFRDNLAPDVATEAERAGVNPYAALAEMIKDVPPGSNGLTVLPYFSGERTPINDPSAKGMVFGLNLLHTRADLYNACLEGVGFGIGQHFEIFRQKKMDTRRVMAVGGGVKNRKWLQIVSDIAGISQSVSEVTVGAAYGDALLAAKCRGQYKDISEMAEIARARDLIVPKPEATKIYRPLLDRYERLYLATKGIMDEY